MEAYLRQLVSCRRCMIITRQLKLLPDDHGIKTAKNRWSHIGIHVIKSV